MTNRNNKFIESVENEAEITLSDVMHAMNESMNLIGMRFEHLETNLNSRIDELEARLD